MNETADTGRAQAAARDGASSGINAPLLIALGALVLTALLYWPTSLEIADVWQDTVRRRYTHGWMVLAVAVWLIWRDRAHLNSIALAPPGGGWVLVAIGSVGWLVGLNAGLLAMTTLAMPLLVLVSTWAVGGWRLARRVAFAVVFVYFALPVWELLAAPLQSLTAFVSLWLTHLAGIPVTMNERVIHIPEGWFEIAGGCNGLHFLIVALGIATLHGEVDRDDWRSRLLLLCLAAALALVTNWLRVFIIIVAGHLTDMQHFLIRVDHYYFGWVLFAFALAFYFYLTSRVPRRSRVEQPPIAQVTTVSRGRLAAAAMLSTAALALGPVWSLTESEDAIPVAAQVPPSLDGWSGPRTYRGVWRPVFANSDEEYLVAYQSASMGEVAIFRAAYHSQRQGKELRGQGNSAAGARHQEAETRRRGISVGNNALLVSEQLVTGSDGREVLIWSVYAVDGQPDTLGLSGQVAYGVRSLLGAPTASVVAIAAECRPDCEYARSALGALSAEALPVLLPSLQAEPPGRR